MYPLDGGLIHLDPGFLIAFVATDMAGLGEGGGISDDDGSAGRITGDQPKAQKMTQHRQSYNKPLV